MKPCCKILDHNDCCGCGISYWVSHFRSLLSNKGQAGVEHTHTHTHTHTHYYTEVMKGTYTLILIGEGVGSQLCWVFQEPTVPSDCVYNMVRISEWWHWLKERSCSRIADWQHSFSSSSYSSIAPVTPFSSPVTPLASSYSLATYTPLLPGYEATSLSVLQVCNTLVGKNASFT